MEEMGTELEFDELERLLGEIPNVSSGNALAVDSIRKRISSISANSCNGTSMEKLCSNGHLEEVFVNKIQEPPRCQIQIGESYRPGDQSLASALGKLSLSEGATEHTWKSWQNHPILLDDQFSSYSNVRSFNTDASMMALPFLRSPNHPINGFPDHDVTGFGPRNNLSIRPVSEEYKECQVGYHQSFETSSPAIPFTHEGPNVNVPIPNLQFSVPSHHQSSQSAVRYMHPQQINQHQVDWNHTRTQEEQFYRMQGEYAYMHHLHNQHLERPNPFQSRGSIINRTLNHKQYFEVPISHRLEQSNHEQLWKRCSYHTGSNQSNPLLPARYIDTIQGMEKSSRQCVPRKILTRTNGLNTVDGTKFVSTDANDSLNYINRNRVVCSNCYARQNTFSPGSECHCHDNFRSSALFTDSANIKILSQKYNSVDEVKGRIYPMAKDQHGCRFLQRKFAEGTAKDIEKIFNEIIDHVAELMTDPFGNYLVQKLLEVCDEDQRMKILCKITRKPGELVRISCDMHGTRAIQKVIETLKTPEQFSMIVSSLKSGIVTLMKSTNGNHVAQYCLQYLTPDYCEFLFDAARNCCVELATDRHGCCVLQKCLSFPDGRHRKNLISEIALNALIISQDPYGNYVVQFILELQLPWATIDILKQLEGNYVDLSMQKYSSNVVEKCLQYAGEGQLSKIVDELINDPRFNQIMQDPYGNFAIQKAFHQSEGSLRAKLVDAMRLHVPVLRTSSYGRKVLATLGKN